VFALVGDVLGDFSQEIEGTEDLEVAAPSTSQIGTGRSQGSGGSDPVRPDTALIRRRSGGPLVPG